MPEQPVVKGNEALRRMAGKALGKSSNSPSSEEGKDPLEEAQKFTKQMAASAIIESEVVKSQASAEKAKAEADEAKAKAERARSGEEEPSKAGFKVTGGVDLGHIDLAKEREDASAELKRLKDEADQSARAVGQENQQLREEIHKQELKVLEITLKTQIEGLGELIKGNASKGTFMDQYNAVMEMAKTLGFSQPTTGGDLTTQIELKRLEFDQTLELKKWTREEKRADREFQRQLNQDSAEREDKKKEAERQVKRDEMFASFPQRIGGAIAKGMVEGGEGGSVSERPRGKSYHIEVGHGESGEVECPSCKQSIGIGPTARTAVCAGCGAKFTVKRTEAEAQGEEE